MERVEAAVGVVSEVCGRVGQETKLVRNGRWEVGEGLKLASNGLSRRHSLRLAVAHHLLESVKTLTCGPNSVIHFPIRNLLLA
jgi:hypothetical protein